MKRELGGGRRLGPRRLQVEEVRRLVKAGGAARSGAGVVARGRAEALSGEEEVAEAAGAREVGCDAGVVLDGGGVAADASERKAGVGHLRAWGTAGTGEPGSGQRLPRLVPAPGALIHGWG